MILDLLQVASLARNSRPEWGWGCGIKRTRHFALRIVHLARRGNLRLLPTVVLLSPNFFSVLLHIASKVFCPSCFCRRAPIAGRESQGVALVLGEQELVRHGMVWAQMRACVLATGAGVCTWHPDPKHSNLQCRTRICVL